MIEIDPEMGVSMDIHDRDTAPDLSLGKDWEPLEGADATPTRVIGAPLRFDKKTASWRFSKKTTGWEDFRSWLSTILYRLAAWVAP